MIEILFFSPTGNVQHLAHYLSNILETQKTPVNIFQLENTDPGRLHVDGHLVLLYPIHAFNPPRTVVRFIRNLPASRVKSASIICVGSSESWMNAAASMPIKRILEKKGCMIHLDELLAMPLTILSPFPDHQAREMIKNAERKLDQVAAILLSGQGRSGNVPLKSRLVARLGRIEGLAARAFGLELRASNACTSCGLCIDQCPEKNIRMGKGNKPAFGTRCLMCLRCVYNCPETAISPRFSKFIPIKGGYQIEKYLLDE